MRFRAPSRLSSILAVVLVVGAAAAAAAMIAPPQSREVDFQTLIDSRIDNLTAVLQEELPDSASSIIPFWEQARSGVLQGSFDSLEQGLAATSTSLYALKRFGAVNDLSRERIQQATMLVAGAVILGFPEADLSLHTGHYLGPDREEQAILGPFLEECSKTFEVETVGEFQLDECVSSAPTPEE